MRLHRQNRPHASLALARYIAVLAIIMLILQYATSPLLAHAPWLTIEQLAFEPSQPLQQPWRFVTTHFIHLNWTHLISNLIAFIGVCVLFRPWLTAGTLLASVCVSVVTASALPMLLQEQASFAGFSALTHAVIAYAAVAMLGERPSLIYRMGILVLCALMVKVGCELYHPAPTHFQDFQTAALAHVGGVIGGIATALLPRLRQHPPA